jgi:hypothetical protein
VEGSYPQVDPVEGVLQLSSFIGAWWSPIAVSRSEYGDTDSSKWSDPFDVTVLYMNGRGEFNAEWRGIAEKDLLLKDGGVVLVI